VTGYWSV